MITSTEAEDRGRRDFLSGKCLEDNPYGPVTRNEGWVGLSTWWDSGYLKAKQHEIKEWLHDNDK